MSIHNFGADVTRTLIDYQDGEPLSLPSQVPAIYLFSTQPTMAAAAAGTGAIGGTYTLNYWTEVSGSPYKRTFTFPAIADPAPTGSVSCVGYWEAVNYVRKASGQTQTVIRQFDVERGAQGDSYPAITITVLKNIFPGIATYATDAQLSAFLDIAIEEVKLDILAKGHKWERLFELNRLKLGVAFKCIADVSFSQVKEDNDKFLIRYKEFEEKYQRFVNSLELPADSDGDNIKDSTVQTKPSYTIVSR
jgi:hypothetical protein